LSRDVERYLMPHDLLNFDYELLHGQRVTSIKGSGVQRGKDGSTVCEKVAVLLERTALIISVNEDTDEVVVQEAEGLWILAGHSSSWTNLELLSEYLGRELGWCWVGRNYRGYADTFVLSFSGLEPEIAFCGVASSLWFYKMNKV
jgi:uncharacterized protein DUF6334